MGRKITFDNKMMVAGHRGDLYNVHENTMKAFVSAIEAGADMIETDVRLTKDLVPVLIHDDKVDRTTDGTGFVKDYTYEELQKLNAGSRTEVLQIPRLEELLELLVERNVLLNLEIKEYYNEENAERCHNCIEQCAALVEKYGLGDKMVFNSFDAHVLEYIDEKYESRYLLHGFYPYSIMHNVERNPDEYLYCACVFAERKKEYYDYLISKNIEPWIGAGVTKETLLRESFEMGAKLVTTNFPANCIEKLKRIGAR